MIVKNDEVKNTINFKSIVKEYFVDNNNFFTIDEIKKIKQRNGYIIYTVSLLGENDSECFKLGFGVVITKPEEINKDFILKSLKQNLNKVVIKFKANHDYEKELIDSGDLERWVKEDGFTIEDLLECKKDYMKSLDEAIKNINEHIEDYFKNLEQDKGEQR